MKAKMWAVYHTKNGKMPRSIHFSLWDAENYARKDFIIKRVEVTFKTGTAYDITYHEYKHIDGKPKKKTVYVEQNILLRVQRQEISSGKAKELLEADIEKQLN